MLKFLSPTLHAILMAPAGDDNGGGGGGGGSETPEQKAAREAAEADAKKKAEEESDPLRIDIQKAIEKARKQEKDKLYGQIEEAKKAAKNSEELALARANEVKTLQQQIAELSAKIKSAGEGEGDDEGKKKGRKTLDEETLNKAIDAAVTATSQKLEEQFKAQLEAAQNRIKELESTTQQKDLASYRDQLISANKDAIVPELVTGTTREELDTNLVLAKQVFARVTQGMKKDPTKQGDEPPAPAAKLVLPPTPNVNDNGAPGAPRQVDVKQLSSGDYAKNRAELLKAAGAAARASLQAE